MTDRAPAGLEAAELGGRLRQLRASAGLSVRELARRLGISASAVSQIERGARQPSVSRLLDIVGVLGVPLADVFTAEPDDVRSDPATDATASGGPTEVVVARAGRTHPAVLDGGVVFRRLSPGPTAGVDFFESTYPPGAVASETDELITHEGYEVGTLTAGVLTVEFADRTVRLAAGDSITFPSALPHRIANTGEVDAVATWLIVHARSS